MNTRVRSAAAVLLSAAVSAGAATLSSADIQTNGMTVTVKGTPLAVAPLDVSRVKKEIQLKPGKPGWRGPVYTPGTAWRFGAMTAGSLKARVGGTVLKEGVDYLVDYDWGTLGALPGSAWSGRKITVEYTYTASRLDLAVEKDGRILLIQGKPDSGTPLLPKTPAGAIPLFSVYLPHNTTVLSSDNINILDLSTKRHGGYTGREFIEPKLNKLAKGEAFTFAFLGDSITAQTDPKGGGFVERFRDWARGEYKNVKYVRMARGKKAAPVSPATGRVAIVMAGVGGDTSVRGLARLDDHVLVHRPDLVFVMFGVNDENRRGNGNGVPPDQYEKNLTELVTRIRGGGGEPVLMTTSMKNLKWEATVGNLDEYARRARKVAAANEVCLIDHFRAWEDLPKQGYNYMILLSSCINHPGAMGHQMFFQAIRALLEGE
jgi:lysophospholipase L1-like esterase